MNQEVQEIVEDLADFKYALGAILSHHFELHEESTPEEIRDALKLFAALAVHQDPLSQAVLKQFAARKLRERLGFESPEALVDTAFKEAENELQ